MREILFKAKIKNWKQQSKENQWVDGYYCKRKSGRYTDFGFEEEYKDCIIKEFSDGGTIFCDIDPETICQYTGLTDKNDRKIFEGDIVKIGLEQYEVWWNCDSSALTLSNESKSRGLYLTHGETIEVIGNIFDNPDLIGDQP